MNFLKEKWTENSLPVSPFLKKNYENNKRVNSKKAGERRYCIVELKLPEWKQRTERVKRTKRCFFEKMNKIDASQANPQKKKKDKRQKKLRNDKKYKFFFYI